MLGTNIISRWGTQRRPTVLLCRPHWTCFSCRRARISTFRQVRNLVDTCQLTCPFVPSLSWQTIVFRLQIFQRTTRGTNFRAMCCRIQPPLAGRHYLCLSPRQWWHPDCGGADGRRLEERPEARGARFPCRCALRLAAQTTHRTTRVAL